MKQLGQLFVLVLSGLVLTIAFANYHGAEEAAPAAQTANGDADVTIVLSAVGMEAWTVNAVEGMDAEELTEIDVENPNLRLAVGERYSFDVSGVDSNFHPLDFRDADGNVLLAQGDAEGTFEGDDEVAFQATENAVTFTMTQELAAAIATYHCTNHPPMVGEIEVTER